MNTDNDSHKFSNWLYLLYYVLWKMQDNEERIIPWSKHRQKRRSTIRWYVRVLQVAQLSHCHILCPWFHHVMPRCRLPSWHPAVSLSSHFTVSRIPTPEAGLWVHSFKIWASLRAHYSSLGFSESSPISRGVFFISVHSVWPLCLYLVTLSLR